MKVKNLLLTLLLVLTLAPGVSAALTGPRPQDEIPGRRRKQSCDGNGGGRDRFARPFRVRAYRFMSRHSAASIE
jgi:hypothetical protein